jgi:hypothetical protein
MLRFFKRPPDFIIGNPDDPYMLRWWIIPRNRFFNIYLHKFLRSDDDRALHDHPWPSVSILLAGNYYEHMPCSPKLYADRYNWRNIIIKQYASLTIKKLRKPFRPVFRGAKAIHRIELERDGFFFTEIPVWSLFITGPKVREWGFWCPKGWRHWRDFTNTPQGEAKGSEVGRGCDD